MRVLIGMTCLKDLGVVVNLHFNSAKEFEDLFSKKNLTVTNTIVTSIERAIIDKKKTAKLFMLTFQNYEDAFEITLPQACWKESLESCLNFYHKKNMQDEQIDTWKLLELVKVL